VCKSKRAFYDSLLLAQVLLRYPHDKYGSANYEQIGKVLYQFTGQPLTNAQQFARRLLVNILLSQKVEMFEQGMIVKTIFTCLFGMIVYLLLTLFLREEPIEATRRPTGW